MAQTKTLKFKSTVVFEQNYNASNDSNIRFILNEGGSRSSKTWSLCQLIIIYLLNNPNKTASIVRKSFPSLRSSVMKDFFEVLRDTGIYNKASHNKTEHVYRFNNGSEVDFFSVDDEQKIRGRKRDLLWCNEANELDYEDFTQLNLRTSDKIIMDYNPSETNSWIYDLEVSSCKMIRSTYKDNPFISQNIINQIEAYKETDPELYEIFGLGNRITPRQNVFSGWEFVSSRPDRFTEFIYGLDFGYNHPTALVKIWYYESELYIEEEFYERYLTSNDIVDRLNTHGINKDIIILADTARPEISVDILTAGYNIVGADKAIKEGINAVKSYKVYVAADAKNIKKEFENYKWKKHQARILDEPIKLWDDAMDAIRYGTKYIKSDLSSQGYVIM